ncbi:DMT family transporter [Salicibibacter kimchii]|uniref:QacE family quaternary ammonium compound efflux SMR transporter n=1 Tax=Salicibibacter kimchii TaxID=2099786 RepID=A0A345C2L7_9BACI|nr:multidrug efflux SMR transporter [Salicibibacter kimchii]AXF57448.1 QacE family quaternary ammonium compound efflux SMR transporter [Salicibibacter kimchii]
MSWIILIIAGLLEVLGVNGIQRYSQGQKTSGILFVVFGFAVSLTLSGIAMENIPLGVAYAIWTGMGTVGSAIVGMVFYNDSKDKKRIMFLAFIVVAVIGLRIVSG